MAEQQQTLPEVERGADALNPTPRSHRKRLNKSILLGGIVLLFAVIGVVATVIFVGTKTYDLIDNKAQKEEFEQFIYPLVMLDPPPFDSVDKLDEKTLLTASIWNLLKNEDTGKYPQDEFGFITVPQTDVESYAAKLFGKDVKVNHQSLGDAEYAFEYDEEAKSYLIPSTPSFPPYTPRVEKIEKNKNTYQLTVDYIPSGNIWGQDVQGKKYEPDAAKTMIYMLQKNSDGYQITAVQTAKDSSKTSSAAAAPESSTPQESVSSEAASSLTESGMQDSSQTQSTVSGSESPTASGAASSGTASGVSSSVSSGGASSASVSSAG